MANEYTELEQLVNDVTSLDTARMTLRWALERLNTIEKEKADLKKNLTLAEETAKRLQVKEASLTDAYSSRSKTLEEKEDFYTKLEATMSLLGEGKLDIQQLLKKEAKLDSLRKSLENEYQDKFEELDRSQRSIIERWNARLLDVESQYAGRLAEAQKKYDSLRSELDADHQGRLTALQASFKTREKEFSERLALLEGSVRLSEEKVETRRRELEGEYLAKKRETEENYRKLKTMLEAGLDEKLRSMDSDHAAQVASLGASWQAERSRLLEEQRLREEQFLAAQARIKEIENGLAAQQEAHHSELLKLISEKETAFRAQLAQLENEKSAKEQRVREISAALEKRVAGWEAERAAMRADFEGRTAVLEAALKAREAELEKNYAADKEELSRVSASQRAGLEKELEERLAGERREMAAERARLTETAARQEAALCAASDKIKELEVYISELKENHRGELMARVSAAEESFRQKLAAFEGERLKYIGIINKMEENLRGLEAAGAEDRARMDAEAAARAAVYERELAELAGRLSAAAKEAAAQRERHGGELAQISAESAARLEERSAALKADYEALAARLAADAAASGEAFKASLAAADEAGRKNREAEQARLEQTLETVSEQFRGAQLEIVALNASIRRTAEENAAREAAITGELVEAKAGFDRELSARVKEAVLAQTAALAEALEAVKAEKNKLSAALEVKDSEIRAIKEEAVRAHAQAEVRLLGAEQAFHAEKLEMQKAHARDVEASVESAVSSVADTYAEKLRAIQEELAVARRSGDGLAQKLLSAEQAFHAEKLEMQKAHARDAEASVESAVSAVAETYAEKLRAIQEELANARQNGDELAQKLLVSEKAHHAEKLELQRAHANDLDAKLESAAAFATETYSEKLRGIQEELARAKQAGDELAQKLMASEKAYHAEKLEMQKAYVKELDASVESAVSSAVEAYAEKLRRTQEELAGARQNGHELAQKLLAAEQAFQAEKLEQQRAHAKEMDTRLETAAASSAEKLNNIQEELAAAKRNGDELAQKLMASEKAYHAEKLEMQKAYVKELDASVESAVSSAVEAYAEKLRRTQEELAGARQNGEVLAQKLLVSEKTYYAEKLEMQKAYVKELDASVESAVSSAVEAYAEKLRRTQEELAGAKQTGDELAQKLLAAEKAFHSQKLEMQKAYVKEMDATLEATLSSAVENYEMRLRRTQEELAGSKKQAVELSEKLLASEKAHHDEKLEMQKAQVRELDNSVESAVAAAVEMLEQRLAHAHEELAKVQKRATEEMRIIEDGFAAEKTRLLEDVDRRDRYIENADRKLQELETEMLKYRQEASSELLRNISEQDRYFREAAAGEKARAEERVSQLEELLAAKEKLLADSDKFCRQKQLDLDKVHADLNLRVNKFNEELFAQKQELNDREKDLNEYRLKLEKEYAFKASELEPMKAELSRAILEYKGRK